MEQTKKGTLFVFLSAFCFSFGGLLVKLIPWGGLTINGTRNLLAAVMLFIYLKKKGHKIRFNRSTAIGAVALFGTTTLYVFANQLTTAANAIVLQFTAPVFIILFSWLFFREKPKRMDIYACIAVFFGIVCFFVDSLSSGGMFGNILAILAGVAYAVVLMTNRLPGGDSLSSILLGMLLSALIGAPCLLTKTVFTPAAILGILLLGTIQVGLGYLFLGEGLAITPPVTACLVGGIEPILNPIWVALLWGEHIGPTALVGAVIVILTIVVYNIKRAKMV